MRPWAGVSPPPPYWVGQVGAVQPLAPMRWRHTSASPVAVRPPSIDAARPPLGLRRDLGKLASNQARASARKASRSRSGAAPSAMVLVSLVSVAAQDRRLTWRPGKKDFGHGEHLPPPHGE